MWLKLGRLTVLKRITVSHMFFSIAQLWMVTSLAKTIGGDSTLPLGICPHEEKTDGNGVARRSCWGHQQDSSKKKELPWIKEDDYFSFLTLLRPQVTECCWVQLGKKGGWSSKRWSVFVKGTYTTNNSCKGSTGYWSHYNSGVFFPKSGFNGKQLLSFLKEHSTQ